MGPFAKSGGLADFSAALQATMAGEQSSDVEQYLVDFLAAHGFAYPTRTATNICLLAYTLPVECLSRMTFAALATSVPDMALNNLERFVSSLGNGDEFVSFCHAQPDVLVSLITIFGASRFLSAYLVSGAEACLKLLSTPDYLALPASKNVLSERLNRVIGDVDEDKEFYRALRIFRKQEMLRIGLRDLLGKADLPGTVAELSDLADVCVQEVYLWIDAGLHATEVANVQALTEMLYQMASRNDAETLRILDDVVLLAAFANPDGLELVANWYMREKEPAKRSMANLPVLYQKYIGHDNNRDFYMSNLPESINMNRVLYSEWFPQIVYNHHQTGPAGAVMFGPPFRDPFNFNFDPMVPIGIDILGAAIANRMAAEGKPHRCSPRAPGKHRVPHPLVSRTVRCHALDLNRAESQRGDHPTLSPLPSHVQVLSP